MVAKPHRAGSSRPGRERRQHPRAVAEWPLVIALPSGRHPARLRDVSRAGVSFYLDRPIALMTVLQLNLELPGARAKRVSGTGAVVRCEKISAQVEHYEIAVFLHEMDEEARAAIEEYVRNLAVES